MIVTLQTERVRTLEQVRAFVEGSEAVDFTGADRESVYEFVRRTLVRLGYERLGKSDKGLVKCYLAKVTGLSRAQLTRLIGRHRETGRIEDRRGGAPACPFERRYTWADIRHNWQRWTRRWARCRGRRRVSAGARWWPGPRRHTAPSGNGASPSLAANPAMCASIPSTRAAMTAPRASTTSTRSMR